MSVYADKRSKHGIIWRYSFSHNHKKYQGTCFGCNSRFEAETYEKDIKQKISLIERGVLQEEIKITFGTLCKIYLQRSKMRYSSHSTNVSRVKKILSYFGKDKLVNEITPLQIETFLYLIIEEGKTNATANRYRACLSGIFKIAVNNNYIKKNPVKFVDEFTENNAIERYLSKEEEVRLFANLNDYLVPIVKCALWTGMRLGEILNLQWTNVDFHLKQIALNVTKNNTSREIPMGKNLFKLLKDIHDEHNNSPYVFVNKSTQCRYKDIYEGFMSALKKANIKNFTFHILRHTAATRMAEKGVDIAVIQYLLGHRRIQTTMRYVHSLINLRKEAIDLLDNYSQI